MPYKDIEKKRENARKHIAKHRQYLRDWKIRNPDKFRKYDKKYRVKNAAKIKARQIVNRAVNDMGTDTVLRPASCQECTLERRLEGHHPDYSNPLVVLWLCKSCHMALHRM